MKMMRNKESTLLKSKSVSLGEVRTLEEVQTDEKIKEHGNIDVSINFFMNQNKVTIDDMFAFSITYEIMHDDYESWFIIECRQRHNWPK